MLEQIIKQQINNKANISFDEFMQLALYHKQYGYYRSNKPKLGISGDFITAPEISDLFGFCVAKQIAEIGGDILEFGAGSGVLATQILSYLQSINKLPDKYYILELSATFKQMQQKNILSILPDLADRLYWLDSIPENFSGVILANEVLDAMPTKRARIRDGYFYELNVGVVNNKLDYVVGDKLFNQKYNLIDGYTTEFNFNNQYWINSLAGIQGKWLTMVIDYGYSEQEFLHPQRFDGTLRCYKNHKADENPFTDIGNKDITSWVNFSKIKEAVYNNNLSVLGYNTQAMFLISLGIDSFLNKSQDKDRLKLLTEIKQLIMPEHMGESFKVMVFGNHNLELSCFSEQNLYNKL